MAVNGLVRRSILKENKKKRAIKSVAKKVLTRFKPIVLTRHPSHDFFKDNIGLQPFRSIVRLGSTTSTQHVYHSRPNIIQSRVVECNTVQAIKNSANKHLMKNCFTRANVKTANWYTATRHDNFLRHSNNGEGQIISVSTAISNLEYPIVAKHIYGSRGTGNYLLKTQEELTSWFNNRGNLEDYIFEEFMNFTREYRLHVTKEGYFYSCRKMLKEETPKENRWFRNDSNCTWYMEENPGFDKPSNWGVIEADCVKALKALTLDIGCFDVKVQSEKDSKGRQRKQVDYIILESGSAPSFGSVTQEKYLLEVPKVLRAKYASMNIQ